MFIRGRRDRWRRRKHSPVGCSHTAISPPPFLHLVEMLDTYAHVLNMFSKLLGLGFEPVGHVGFGSLNQEVTGQPKNCLVLYLPKHDQKHYFLV